MSLRARKQSAFSVFSKQRKATSLSSMPVQVTPKLGKKSKSASTTPTNSTTGSIGSNTDKKKKMDMKKIKKLLKSASKKRPSFLPDSALQSPLIGQLGNGDVELRSLRPKGSMVNAAYPLPLRATPDATRSRPPIPTWNEDSPVLGPGPRTFGRDGKNSTTPPLPPKPKQVVKPLVGKKRGSMALEEELSLPQLPPRAVRAKNILPPIPFSPAFTEAGSMPPRPAKRRRISQGSAPPSPTKRLELQLSPDGGRERMEPMPSHPKERPAHQPYMYDSLEEARRLFECLIHPVVPHKFFSELWEKKPLLVKRHQPDYNDGWFSTAELDRILREEQIRFSENLDVVSYENGKRETHNPDGRAHAAVVWDYYQNNCSVRLLNPQTYSKNVWKLLAILQEYFGCCVGANIYLTPPGTQGFAPHWDDIEAFILQLEGKKHWKLYSPRSENETLPRHSSGNFTDSDIGSPILDVILEAGDLLYFPRGTIHQGCTVEGEHSLHITVSCYQKNTWGDVLEKLVPQALQVAIEEDVEFRRALPKDYLNYMGVAFSDKNCPERQNFLNHVEQLMRKLITMAPVDSACDQMGKKYIHDSLPPVLTEAEKFCSVHGQGERWDASERRVVKTVELEPDTCIKLIRRGCIRLVTEDDKVLVYHNLENARVYHGNAMQSFDVTAEMAPAVEYLLHAYPDFVEIESLPLEELTQKVYLVSVLYDKGLIVTQEPLEPHSESSESDPDRSDGSAPERATVSRKPSKSSK